MLYQDTAAAPGGGQWTQRNYGIKSIQLLNSLKETQFWLAEWLDDLKERRLLLQSAILEIHFKPQ